MPFDADVNNDAMKFDDTQTGTNTSDFSGDDMRFDENEQRGTTLVGGIETQVKPWVDQYTKRFQQSHRDFNNDVAWSQALIGLKKKEDVMQFNVDLAEDDQRKGEIDQFNKDTDWYAAKNILNPAMAVGDIASSAPQMAASFTGGGYGAAIGAGVGIAATALTGGLAAPAIPIMTGLGAFGGMYTANANLFAGNLYRKYSQLGVDDATAKRMAITGALSMSLYETAGDMLLKGVATKKALKVFAKSPQGKIAIQQTIINAMNKIGWAGVVAEMEGLTEAGEKLSEMATDAFVRRLDQSGNDLSALAPNFSDLRDSLVAGTRAGVGQSTGAHILQRVMPQNLRQAIDEVENQITDVANAKKAEADAKKKKVLEGNVSIAADEKEMQAAIQTADIVLSDLLNQEDDALISGRDVTPELRENIAQARADLAAERKRLKDFKAKEKIEKYEKGIDELNKAIETANDPEQKERLRKIAGQVEERLVRIQKQTLKQEMKVREAAVEKRTSEINEEIIDRTYGQVQRYTDEINELKKEDLVGAEPATIKRHTKKLQGLIEKRDQLKAALKGGSLTLENFQSRLEGTGINVSALLQEKEKLKGEQELINHINNLLERDTLTAQDLVNLNQDVQARSARSLARRATRQSLRAFAEGRKLAKDTSDLQAMIRQFIKNSGVDDKTLPDVSTFKANDKKLQDKLNALIDSVQKLRIKSKLKEANARLDKALEKAAVKRDKNLKVNKSKFDPESTTQKALDLIKMFKENIDAFVDPPEGEFDFYNMIWERVNETDFKNADSANELADLIESIIENGLAAWKDKRAQLRSRIDAKTAIVWDAIQGDQPIADTTEGSAELAAWTEKRKKKNSEREYLMSWRGLMHKLMQRVPLKRRQAIIDTILSVDETVQEEEKMHRETMHSMRNHIKKEAKINAFQLAWLLIKANVADHKNWIYFKGKGKDGSEVFQAMPPGTALQMWMYWQNPNLRTGLEEGNNYSQEVIDSLEQALKDDNRHWIPVGRGLMNWYQETFKALAAEYKSAYGVELDPEKFYAGFVRRAHPSDDARLISDILDSEMRSYSQDKGGMRAATSKSTIERQVESKLRIRPVDAFQNAFMKAKTDTHWIAWREKSNELALLLKNSAIMELRNAKFTKEFNATVDLHQLDMVKGILDRHSAYLKRWNILLSNSAIQMLGGWKPQAFFKQLTGLYAISASEVGHRGLLGYMNELFGGELNALNELKPILESDWYKTRFDNAVATLQGQIRENELANIPKQYLSQFFLFLLTGGDRAVALFGGYALMRHYIDAGFSQKEAISKAGLFIEQTQSSRLIQNQSLFQRDPRWKWLTMFMQQQNAVYELQHLAFMEAKNHKSIDNWLKAAKITGVLRVAQVLFTAAGNLDKLDGDDDDDRDQALWDIVVDFVNGPLPAPIGDLAKLGEAQLANVVIDKYRLSFNKPSVREYRAPVSKAIQSAAKLIPQAAKIFDVDDGRDIKVSDALAYLQLINEGVLIWSSKFGYVPTAPTVKQLKSKIGEETIGDLIENKESEE